MAHNDGDHDHDGYDYDYCGDYDDRGDGYEDCQFVMMVVVGLLAVIIKL